VSVLQAILVILLLAAGHMLIVMTLADDRRSVWWLAFSGVLIGGALGLIDVWGVA
jgi:NhaP-type Na+/H+ or K+/H+ antiporter